MSRGYFDLQAQGNFSFAQALCARGYIVVTLDPLGIGESSRPKDGHELTPEILARANAAAVAAIHSQLRSSDLAGRPLGAVRAIGVGHSMGAMLTGVQQAHHASYAGLMLFGFGTKGLVVALSEEEKRFAGDPAGTRANLVRLARLRSPDPYPPGAAHPAGAGPVRRRHCRPPRRRGPQPRARRTAADRGPVFHDSRQRPPGLRADQGAAALGIGRPRHGRSTARGAGQLPRQQRHHVARAARDWARALPVRLASSSVRARSQLVRGDPRRSRAMPQSESSCDRLRQRAARASGRRTGAGRPGRKPILRCAGRKAARWPSPATRTNLPRCPPCRWLPTRTASSRHCKSLRPGSALAGIDGGSLLGERAALSGYTPRGCCFRRRQLPFAAGADGWLAVNLARDQRLGADAGVARERRHLRLGRAGGLTAHTRSGTCASSVAGCSGWPWRRCGREYARAWQWCRDVHRVAAGSCPPPTAPCPWSWTCRHCGRARLCTNLLQLMGAQVIKVESTTRPDGLRRAGDGFYRPAQRR